MPSSLSALRDLSALFASLCARARAQRPLSPGERAILKFVTSTGLYAALATLVVLFGQVGLAGGVVTPRETLAIAGIIFLGALANGVKKLYDAKGDTQVGAALALLSDETIAAACLASGLSPQMAEAIAAAIRGQFTVSPPPAAAPTPAAASPNVRELVPTLRLRQAAPAPAPQPPIARFGQ